MNVLPISDMVVSVAGSPIVHCVQTPMVRVAYRPNTHIPILLLFPHHQQLMLTAPALIGRGRWP